MGLIPEDVVRQVLDRTDIVETVSSHIALTRAGRNFKAPCPFHNEKTPSFIVNPDKQIFHCFGCGVGGNAVTFIMNQEHLTFPEVIRSLAEKYGIPIPESQERNSGQADLRRQLKSVHEVAVNFFHRNLIAEKRESVETARTYLKDRGLDLETVRQFQLGFALDEWEALMNTLRQTQVSLSVMEAAGLIIARQGQSGYYDRYRNRIMFPIFDIQGSCIAFGARTMEQDNPAKYVNSPESPIYSKGHHLYGLNWAKDSIVRQDSVIVVEGYMDFIMPYRSGVQNVVASLGTALTVEQIRLLRRFTRNVVMLFDSDTAGQAATMRSLDLLIEEGMTVQVATLSPGEDPDSYIRKQGVEEFQQRIAEVESLFDFKLKTLLAHHGRQTIDARAQVSVLMLETIDKFSNTILKTEYVKRLAQRLSLSQDALLVELNKVKSRRSSGSPSGARPKEPEGKTHGMRAVERDMLRLLLHEQELIPLTKEDVSLADFHNETVRRIVERIFELFERDNTVDFSALLSSFSDQQSLETISSLTAGEHPLPGDKKKMHRDCLIRLQHDRKKIMRQELLQQMEDAQQQGDTQRMQELTQQFNQSIKR